MDVADSDDSISTFQLCMAVRDFLLKSYAHEVYRLLQLPHAPDEHVSFPVCFISLADKCPHLANLVCLSPSHAFELLDAALVAAQAHLFEQIGEQGMAESQGQPVLGVKNEAHVRLHSFHWLLDPSPHPSKPNISEVSSHHLGKLVTISGTITKASQIKQFESKKLFRCRDCKTLIQRLCHLEEGGQAHPPESCHDPSCLCSSFDLVENHQMFLTGLQEIRVQEKIESLSMGCMPKSVPIFLKDDLVDKVKPGEDIEITGMVIPRWPALRPGDRCVMELVVVAHDLRRMKKRGGGDEEGGDRSVTRELTLMFEDYWMQQADQRMMARDHIIGSVCPRIHGLKIVKLSILLMLLGGVPRNEEGGEEGRDQDKIGGGVQGGRRSRIRGDIHLLLIGDPGLGKSQLMRYAALLSPRSVIASGRGVTSAGLTATAVKESGPQGQWVLEAGALVLADGGLCVIDEFEGIPDGSSGILHEAMEQQTVHVAKAGIVATLSTRASILAATNPKKGWSGRGAKSNLSDATDISGPLLSRFDIVLVLQDVRNHAHDRDVANHILSTISDEKRAQMAQRHWSIEILRSYLEWAGGFHPVMSQEAEHIISTYYQSLRQGYDRNSARTTIRALEGLVRVATAHARLMGRDIVTVDDACVSVLISETTQNALQVIEPDSTVLDGYGGRAEDPDRVHLQLKRRILTALGIGRLPPSASGLVVDWQAVDGQ